MWVLIRQDLEDKVLQPDIVAFTATINVCDSVTKVHREIRDLFTSQIHWDTLCHGVSMVHLRIFGRQWTPVGHSNAWSICGLDAQVKKQASGKKPCKCLNGSCQASWNPMSWHLPVLFVHVLGMAVSKLWPSCKLWLHGRRMTKTIRHSTQPPSLHFCCFKNGQCCWHTYIFW